MPFRPTRLPPDPARSDFGAGLANPSDDADFYQNGRYAYCGTQFTSIGTSRVAVDDVIPFVLMANGPKDGDLHQIWKFVLAC